MKRSWHEPFRGVDYYQAGELLTEQERTGRDTVQRWIDNQYMPHVQQYSEQGIFDKDLIPQLAELGLLETK